LEKSLAQRRKGAKRYRVSKGFLCAFAPLREKVLLSLLAVTLAQPHFVAAQTQSASISIDARRVENRISPLLYGQFLEFMYEGIKGGLHA